MISCRGPQRAAYGWQRDGGHADYLLAEETTCLPLPDALTYVDGALAACGFGTCYEALTRVGLCGTDRLLVTGLGPVGLAAAMLGRAMGARTILGVEVAPGRIELAEKLGLFDRVLAADDSTAGEVMDLTAGRGCEVTIDCSGAPAGRELALRCTRDWGRCAYVGEGGTVSFDVSQMLIHKQITLYGSWVTSLKHMEDLLERLERWDLHPEQTVTDSLPLDRAAEAYRIADEGQSGKVCIVFED
jgi:threonine dehydrogenase-like Zn-dependent dehydrogenase